jgi:hypothetical protein
VTRMLQDSAQLPPLLCLWAAPVGRGTPKSAIMRSGGGIEVVASCSHLMR